MTPETLPPELIQQLISEVTMLRLAVEAGGRVFVHLLVVWAAIMFLGFWVTRWATNKRVAAGMSRDLKGD